jgi:hypothetical protein
MESKKINQLATELAPDLSDLTIIGDPTTGISKKITLSQMASLFTGTVEEYANFAAFPLVGVADTIYIALDTNVIYRYDTSLSAYVILSPNIINSLVFSDANGFDGTISLVGSVATLSITTALTLGSVPFIGASGALTQDNSNLFFDDTNNRLGIGTTLPTTPLDVFGSGIIGRLNATSTNNAYLGFASNGTNKWSAGNVQSDHRFRIFSEANSAELITILQTGEFGIGISNPTTKFHIDGGATALIANLDTNVSVAKSISFRSDNSSRINLEVSGTESGSNAGADFFLRTFTDLGALIETPFSIARSTGVTTIKSLTLTNVLSVANGGTGSATQNFVDLTTTQSIGGAKTFTSALAGTSASFSSTSTATAFIPSGATVPTNGMYLSAANTLNFATNTINRLEISSSGITSILGDGASLVYQAKTVNADLYLEYKNSAGTRRAYLGYGGVSSSLFEISNSENGAIDFRTNATFAMRITSAGRIGIGTNSPDTLFQVAGTGSTGASVRTDTSGDAFHRLYLDSTNYAHWFADRANSKVTFGSVASVPLTFVTGSVEAMRIQADGRLIKTANNTQTGQFQIGGQTGSQPNAILVSAADENGPYPMGIKALSATPSQGLFGFFDSANATQGSITIAGTSVSYNSFMGSHYSQLKDNSKPEILKGTILETIDELCEWEDEINDRLAKVKISDTIQSKNVYGIFLGWDNTDEFNDMLVAALGASFIRINKNEIISMGDLLQSNGDGTAKVQSDDIMRSSTIAKVVSTNKIETYEDGSYLIAATLHCG